MAKSTTKEIPAWSRNLSVNVPRDWAQALADLARKLKVSQGEILRRITMAGALSLFPEVGKVIVAAHQRYYPHRALSATIGSLALLLLFLTPMLASGLGYHGKDLRTAARVRVARHSEDGQWITEV